MDQFIHPGSFDLPVYEVDNDAPRRDVSRISNPTNSLFDKTLIRFIGLLPDGHLLSPPQGRFARFQE